MKHMVFDYNVNINLNVDIYIMDKLYTYILIKLITDIMAEEVANGYTFRILLYLYFRMGCIQLLFILG